MTPATTADRVRQSLNVLFGVGQVVATFLPPILGYSRGLGEDGPGVGVNPLMPPGQAFAIWGLLFPALMAYAICQAAPGRATDPILRHSGWFTAAALGLTTAWISLSQTVGVFPAADALFSAAILLCYLLALTQVGLGPRLYWGVTVPIALSAGWLTVAFGVNLAAAIIAAGIVPAPFVAGAVVVGTGIAGVLVPWLFGSGVLYAGPVTWGLVWVVAGNLEPSGNASVVALAGVAALVIVASGVVRSLPPEDNSLPLSPTAAARLAYASNILILSPVLVSLFVHSGDGALAAFGGTVRNEDGLRLLVASLWLSIMVLSAVGLAWPRPLLMVLALQVVYKTCYLVVYVLPKLGREGWTSVPLGVALCFVAIVVLWPAIIYLNAVASPRSAPVEPREPVGTVGVAG